MGFVNHNDCRTRGSGQAASRKSGGPLTCEVWEKNLRPLDLRGMGWPVLKWLACLLAWGVCVCLYVYMYMYVCTLVIKMITCNYFCFRELNFWRLQLQLHFKSLAKLILEKCNSSWGKPPHYNYISELQEELICKKNTVTITFLI